MAINIPTISEKFLDNNGQVNSTWYNYLRTGGASNIGDVLPNFFIVSGAYIQESNYWLNLSIDNGWLSGDTYQGAYADLLKLSDASSVNIRFITSDARATEIATYGESGAFVLDTNNKRFKIPMVTKSIGNLSTLSDIGTVFGNSAASGTATYAGVKFPFFMKVGNKTLEASTVDLKKEAADQKAAISSLGQAQLEAISSAGVTQIALIEASGTAQVNAITSAGTIQYDAITLNGTTWKNDIIATGTLWNNNVASTGSEQVGLVNSAGATQVGLVNTAGDTQVGLVNSAGATQIGLVEGEGNVQVARVISEGNTQVSLVETEGAEQIALAEAAADEAAGYAAQAGTSALPLFTPLYLDYIPENSGYVLSDGSSYVSGSVYTTAYDHLVDDYTNGTSDSETVSGVSVTFVRAPDGHKIIDVANIANYQGILSATGTAWYYVLDQTNTRFMLPFTNWFIQGGATTAGSLAAYQAAGLPNITGSLVTQSYSLTGGAISVAGSGALTSNNAVLGVGQFSVNSGPGVYSYGLDASLSNSIYGNSTTVQPKSNKLGLYFVCGNSVTNTYLIDAAGLASKELSNLNISLAQKNIGLKNPGDILPDGTTNFKLANNATDATNDIDIGIGYTTASSGDAAIILATAMTKRLDANWAAGTNQGGLATGLTKTNSTWYHAFAILNPSTGVTDVGFDTSITATNLLAGASGFTKSQYINSVYVQSTGIIRPFIQIGKEVFYTTRVFDISVLSLPVAYADITLSVPPGIIVEASVETYSTGSSTNGAIWQVYIQDKASNSERIVNALSSTSGSYQVSINNNVFKTNTSAQIAYKKVVLSGTITSNFFSLITNSYRLI